jgi:hypothetical protein
MTYRKYKPNLVRSILGDVLKYNRLEKGIEELDIKAAWAKLMGNGVTNYTEDVQVNEGVLYVKLSSAVLREELSYGKEKIIKLINEELRKEVILKIVLR